MGVLLVCMSALHAAHTQAQEQFVLADETFTATSENTMMSQYPMTPSDDAPANWRTPVDWATGNIYVRFEIMEKPSDRKTLCNVCFETAGTLTCQPYPPAYSAEGVFTIEQKISTFWQYEVFDWTKRVERVHVVLKSEDTKLVQGNPEFYPSKMRVTVTIVPPGKKYQAPAPMTPDAGVSNPDAGAPPAGAAGAAGRASGAGAGGRTSAAVGGRAAAGRSGAGAVTAPVTAGRGSTGSSSSAGRADSTPIAAGSGGKRSISDYIEPGPSCSAAPGRARLAATPGAILLLAFVFGAGRVRRRRSRA